MSNAYFFYIDHCKGHGPGYGCELKQAAIDEDRMVELWAETRDLVEARQRVMGL